MTSHPGASAGPARQLTGAHRLDLADPGTLQQLRDLQRAAYPRPASARSRPASRSPCWAQDRSAGRTTNDPQVLTAARAPRGKASGGDRGRHAFCSGVVAVATRTAVAAAWTQKP